jgi:DNA/RNA-binding domain of Phe-tRNA-synthetase-like protein
VTVYVDKAAHPYGGMIMCHMIADTPDELRTMADRIGVALKWFQHRASTPHFDIARSKRALAIAAGAVELERREFVAAMRRIRATWPRGVHGGWLLSSPRP